MGQRKGGEFDCRAERRPAERICVGRGQLRGCRQARELPFQRGEGPVARRRQRVATLRESHNGVACGLNNIRQGPESIAVDQVDCKQLWFVGQGDAYGAVVRK